MVAPEDACGEPLESDVWVLEEADVADGTKAAETEASELVMLIDSGFPLDVAAELALEIAVLPPLEAALDAAV